VLAFPAQKVDTKQSNGYISQSQLTTMRAQSMGPQAGHPPLDRSTLAQSSKGLGWAILTPHHSSTPRCSSQSTQMTTALSSLRTAPRDTASRHQTRSTGPPHTWLRSQIVPTQWGWRKTLAALGWQSPSRRDRTALGTGIHAQLLTARQCRSGMQNLSHRHAHKATQSHDHGSDSITPAIGC
jgi:hypothetical protein